MTEQSPSGSCHLRLLEQLHDEFDFTVFATTFDNPAPSRIRAVTVPALPRPMAARYVSFYLTSAASRKRFDRFDIVQSVEGYTGSCDISYVHFCHRAYLRRSRNGEPRPARQRIRRLDHQLRALGERRALTRPWGLVVPSSALQKELIETYAVDEARIRVVPNPIDVSRLERPADFDRAAMRQSLGASPDDLVMVFVALGHFERKGLPILLRAVAAAPTRLRLVVVGGTPDLVRSYQQRARVLGIDSRVRWTGMQPDIRPYLWAADLLAAPSAYETFSLVLHQGAAAGLPLLATRLPGITDFIESAHAGFLVARNEESITNALESFVRLDANSRATMGQRASRSVGRGGTEAFADSWRNLYHDLLMAREARNA